MVPLPVTSPFFRPRAMQRLSRFVSLVLLLLGALPLLATAQTTPAEVAPTAVADGFGQAMAVAGDDLFVGEARSIHASGRVLTYQWDGDAWTQTGELTAQSAEVGDGFGRAIAIDGDRLLIGAQDVAHVFERSGDGWTQTASLTPPASVMDGEKTRAFGTQVALNGTTAVVNVTDPPFTFDPGPRAVVVFDKSSDAWTSTQIINAEAEKDGSGYGDALVLADGELIVGAPRENSGAGAVHVYAPGDDGWTHQQTLTGHAGSFGASLLRDGDDLLIGAPRAMQRTGAVQVATRSGDTPSGEWAVESTMVPFDAPSNAAFGTAIARTGEGSTTWIGAPGADREMGAVYQFSETRMMKLLHPDTRPGDGLGRTLVGQGSLLVAGQPGKNYGARMFGTSSIVAFETEAGDWTGAPMLAPDREVFTAVTGEKVSCTDGEASVFHCENMDLLSHLPINAISDTDGIRLNDVWGWTDAETGREWAVVGRVDGTAFVDVTDPMRPVYVAEMPATEGTVPKIWRDVKVYADHAFVVADNVGEHGMQVFDLTQLRDIPSEEQPKTFEATAIYDGVHSAHNVFINEDTGFAYIVASNGGGNTCGGGLHMVDVRTPTEPTFAGCFADVGTGMTGTGTTHDTQCVVYSGPDERYEGQEICFSSNETAVNIADVTDKTNPVSLARAEHPRTAYIHQGWLTEDQRYLYVNDELDEMNGITDKTRTLIWDVSQLDDPQFVTEFLLPVGAADHNLYIRGDTMYQANYASGLRVVDISDPEAPREIGHFDTLPFGADAPVFEGAFSNYPFFDSGVVIVTSIQEGLFVLKRSQTEL